VSPTGNEWLATGGAYWVIAIQTLITIVFSVYISFQIGKQYRAENDGCLLAIANLLLTLFGAGAGYFIAPFPIFLLTSLIGAVLFPTVWTLLYLRRLRRDR
jgi:hypothetical protein